MTRAREKLFLVVSSGRTTVEKMVAKTYERSGDIPSEQFYRSQSSASRWLIAALLGHPGAALLRSCLPGREKYYRQLKQELSAQIRAVQKYFPENAPVRLDGHAHYHMLPVVFDAMMDVIREEKLKVSYIRIPREHMGIYFPCLHKLRDFSPINLIKVLILNLLARRAERKYGKELKNLEKKLFLGVFLSGRMYYENIIHFLPRAVALAEKRGMNLEILGHPGGVFEEADIARITSAEDRAFLTNDLRNREKSLFLIDL
jgi:hypothetical protein